MFWCRLSYNLHMARGKQSASSPPRATLIGDIVGSRRVADRERGAPGAEQRAARRRGQCDRSAGVHGRRRVSGQLSDGRRGDRCGAVAAVGRRARHRRQVRHRLGRGDGARRQAQAFRTVRDGGRRARPSSGRRPRSGNRAWRWCARRSGATTAATSTPSTPP